MYERMMDAYQFLFEGLFSPVFYRTFYPTGCRDDAQWAMLHYSWGLKIDKDPSKEDFARYEKEYDKDLRAVLNHVMKETPKRKRGVIVIPSSNADVTNRVTELVRRVLASNPDPFEDLTKHLRRTETKAAAHAGGSRSLEDNVKTLSLSSQIRLTSFDVILVIDDIVTSGKSFQALCKFLRNAGFGGQIYNFAFARTMPGVCIDAYKEYDPSFHRGKMPSSKLEALIFDLDQTLLDSFIREMGFEDGSWDGGKYPEFASSRKLGPYQVFEGIDELMRMKTPFAIVSNRSVRQLRELFKSKPLAEAIFKNHSYISSGSKLPEEVFSYPLEEKEGYPVKCYKPCPAGVSNAIAWLSRRNSRKEDALRIVGLGNTLEDMIAYRLAGIESALALWGVPEWCKQYACDNWGADYVFESVAEFAEWRKKQIRSQKPKTSRVVKEETLEAKPVEVASEAKKVPAKETVAPKVESASAPKSNPDRALVLRQNANHCVVTNPDRAVQLLSMAYELDGSWDLASTLVPLIRKGNYSAIELYEKEIVSKNERLANNLAEMIKGILPEKAKGLYERAIAEGDERYATCNLANLIRKEDPELAESLYMRAIAAGDSIYAACNLGTLIVKKDPKRAAELFGKAISAGEKRGAPCNLAHLLTTASPDKAIAFYEMSLANGEETEAMIGLAYLLRDADPSRSKTLLLSAKKADNRKESVEFYLDCVGAISKAEATRAASFLESAGFDEAEEAFSSMHADDA